MAKTRKHTVEMRLTFNKPCSARHAVAAAKDSIHGDFYPYAFEESDPDLFKVRGFRAPHKPSPPKTKVIATYREHYMTASEGHIWLDKPGACTVFVQGAASMTQTEVDYYGGLLADAINRNGFYVGKGEA